MFGKQCSVFGVLFGALNVFRSEQCSFLNVFGDAFVFGSVRVRVRVAHCVRRSCSCSGQIWALVRVRVRVRAHVRVRVRVRLFIVTALARCLTFP